MLPEKIVQYQAAVFMPQITTWRKYFSKIRKIISSSSTLVQNPMRNRWKFPEDIPTSGSSDRWPKLPTKQHMIPLMRKSIAIMMKVRDLKAEGAITRNIRGRHAVVVNTRSRRNFPEKLRENIFPPPPPWYHSSGSWWPHSWAALWYARHFFSLCNVCVCSENCWCRVHQQSVC